MVIRFIFILRTKIVEQLTWLDKLISRKFTTEFESVVVFRTANIVEDKDDKIIGLRLIGDKYLPETCLILIQP